MQSSSEESHLLLLLSTFCTEQYAHLSSYANFNHQHTSRVWGKSHFPDESRSVSIRQKFLKMLIPGHTLLNTFYGWPHLVEIYKLVFLIYVALCCKCYESPSMPKGDFYILGKVPRDQKTYLYISMNYYGNPIICIKGTAFNLGTLD